MPARYAVHLELDGRPEGRPEHLHGVVSDWLDPRARHTRNRKPWALGPLEHVTGPVWRFEVGTLDDESEGRLVETASRCPRVALGHASGRVAADGGGQGAEVLRSASWSELAERAAPARSFRFEFVSPTTFRSGTTTIPLPLPTLVFGHFRSRWNAFAPDGLRPHAPFGDINLLLSHVDIATPGPLRFKHATHVGFVGCCTIEASRCTDDLRRSLDALASIAPFSGTGAGTTFGMGVTRYLGPF